MLNSVRNSGADSLAVLHGDAEGLIDETDLGSDISLEQPPNLSFSDQVHRLVSSYRVHGTGHELSGTGNADPVHRPSSNPSWRGYRRDDRPR